MNEVGCIECGAIYDDDVHDGACLDCGGKLKPLQPYKPNSLDTPFEAESEHMYKKQIKELTAERDMLRQVIDEAAAAAYLGDGVQEIRRILKKASQTGE